jgi:alpha-mannosidase
MKSLNHIYSWVLNNYWVTNFKASQQGELRWTYSITSSSDNSDMFSTKFGWGDRVPLLSRVMPPSHKSANTTLTSRSFINLDAPNLLLVNIVPSLDGKGIILHVREVEGDHAILDIRRLIEETKAISIHEVNVLEEELAVLTSDLMIEHYETKFIKLNFEEY